MVLWLLSFEESIMVKSCDNHTEVVFQQESIDYKSCAFLSKSKKNPFPAIAKCSVVLLHYNSLHPSLQEGSILFSNLRLPWSRRTRHSLGLSRHCNHWGTSSCCPKIGLDWINRNLSAVDNAITISVRLPLKIYFTTNDSIFVFHVNTIRESNEDVFTVAAFWKNITKLQMEHSFQ